MKVAVLLILAVPALAIAYYFAVALPANQRATLEFEKQKYASDQFEKKRLNEESIKRDEEMEKCIGTARDNFDARVQLNGEKTAKGGFSVATVLADSFTKQMQVDIEECRQRYRNN